MMARAATRTLSPSVGLSRREVSFGVRKSAMQNDTQHGSRRSQTGDANGIRNTT